MECWIDHTDHPHSVRSRFSKNALVQAKEWAQQAVTAKLSAARPAQDELLRLEALAAEGKFGLPISRNVARFMRVRGEVATREADELNYLHQAEIALAHANVVDCDMAATAMHKAATMEIATQRAELEAADAADRHIVATPPESESEERTDSNDSDAESSSEENC
jgi:hypothetical protein